MIYYNHATDLPMTDGNSSRPSPALNEEDNNSHLLTVAWIEKREDSEGKGGGREGAGWEGEGRVCDGGALARKEKKRMRKGTHLEKMS